MTGTVSRQRGFLFRKARSMPGGRLIARSGQSFMILEPHELGRLQSLLMLSVAIDLLGIVAMVAAFVLSEQGAVSEAALWSVIWIAMGIMVLSAVAIGPFVFLIYKNRTQPIDQRDRIQELWDRAD